MSQYKHLLFELGTEELPPKTLLTLSRALQNNMVQGLTDAGLSYKDVKAYATPRRLAVFVSDLVTAQPDKTVEKRGPAIQAAFMPDGTPSKAAQGFAVSCGASFDQLERLVTDKGEWLAYHQAIKGQATENLIPGIISKSIADLPIAKRMRWGSFATEFVRPVHWVVLLFGEQIIEAEILGLKAGAHTRGHRFHAPQSILLERPETYSDVLYQQGHVIADFETRKDIIRQAAHQAASDMGGIAHIEDDLLEEIAALNEWPVPVVGHFDQRFLELPAEVLITTMQTNQKYFPVKRADGSLLAHFITFSNIESKRPASIQTGNERVITPRLSDAEFFWKQDRKKSLEDRIESLNSIVFQKTLGTLADKTHRVKQLADYIAAQLDADSELAKRAAMLAKTDLMTDMVGEFANLQGTMGRYYALADNEPEEVALALEEQYFPKQSGGLTPSSVTGQILSIAEKIDTLTGIFSAGLIPTGDKDPYALRRAALGVLRIIIERELALDLVAVVEFALEQFVHDFNKTETQDRVIDFIYERLRGYCLDKGYKPDEFDAVYTIMPREPLDFMQRLQAVKLFRQLPEAESLAGANKRIRNILKKSGGEAALEVTGLVEIQELTLLAAAKESAEAIQPLLEKRDYQAVLSRLASLKDGVDAFFDHVMVMTDDLILRNNRLALLELVSGQFLTCADISKLQS
ncbi:MAG: glycine--tRNA ligase subunit beta [Methylicorpusculum sp.]|uniref:glycine--tRNA ligase subunit beta n=1 Tax=Methylicorpusculum sp. TaxID=2713644 RepID=UPI0027278D81|nr:glycine--tRNA ligase subunit beta [Methylicorpusculum sp.]MDO8843779.1 glycine--tRNA ligase subunit beta [Methylicorpusculum sp.]MDO8939631.1 glycine--tRNA ligase subunit beta [Methylicorpusculum sp.]MDP2203655.1 glycine--tRNA ligase subunit beta [Methylicorpusculum sp.]